MRKFLKSKKGVTLLEGLIALALLAIVATGSFAVLLSSSRKTSSPDLREELVLAVERAHEQLQAYVAYTGFALDTKRNEKEIVPAAFKDGLCGAARIHAKKDDDPLGNGTHDIKCLLPPICDQGNVKENCDSLTKDASCFVYRINAVGAGRWSGVLADEAKDKNLNETNWGTMEVYNSESPKTPASGKTVEFEIRCNGYTLTK